TSPSDDVIVAGNNDDLDITSNNCSIS
ncbi:hypothetical protein UFOVP34_1, partial [uncultured Caudovirales phage]